jgi:hypothetical protein
VNTSFMMGGALGLAVLAAIATSRTDTLLAAGDTATAALTGGYHYAFVAGAVFAVVAAAGALLLRPKMPAYGAHGEEAAVPAEAASSP